MPTKEVRRGTGIFAELEEKATEKLRNLDNKQAELSKENERGLTAYEQSVRNMLSGEKVSVEELSKLDNGIRRGKEFEGEISELAESLTGELQELGQFFGDMTQYKGLLENVLARIGLNKWADKKRMSRVKSADVKQNLQTILDYGQHMVSKLYAAILENLECHTKIDGTIRETSRRLEENQPNYERWRAEREGLDRQLNELEIRMNQAAPMEFAKLEGEKSALQKKLNESQINENHYFTIVDKAKKALPVQRKHFQAYKDMVDGLTQLRTGLEQDLDHVTQVYLAVPTAIKTALGTKAASQYDKGMKYATDIATDTVLKSAEGILDEVASRAERPLIEPEKLAAYRRMQIEMRAEFDRRIEELKKKHALPAGAPS